MKSSSDIPWTRSIMAAILDLKCLPLTWQLSPHFWETLISWHSPRLTSCASKTNNYYHPLHFRPESAMSNRPTKAFVFLLLPLSFWCNWQGKDTAIGNGRPSWEAPLHFCVLQRLNHYAEGERFFRFLGCGFSSRKTPTNVSLLWMMVLDWYCTEINDWTRAVNVIVL